jgi:hypothetical protein
MSRYFLHLINGIGVAPDEEGVDVARVEQAAQQAIAGIRSIVSDEAKRGRIDLNGRVDIADEEGRIQAVIPFSDAFELSMPAGRAHPEID